MTSSPTEPARGIGDERSGGQLESEVPVCASCGCCETNTLRAACRDLRYGGPGIYDIVRCVGCGLAYLSPRPTKGEITRFYPDHYIAYEQAPEKPIRSQGGVLGTIRRMIVGVYEARFGPETPRWVYEDSGDVLDVGCGNGRYLQHLSEHGWRPHGTDVSDRALKATAELVAGVELHRGRLPNLQLPSSSFDLVTMRHVLEHTHNPKEHLAVARELLRGDGRLLVAVPNLASPEAHLFGRWWMGLDVPRHLYYFSTDTLGTMLTEVGFSEVEVRPQLHLSTIPDSIGNIIRTVMGRTGRVPGEALLYYLLFPLSVSSIVLGNWGCIEMTART